MLNKEMDTGSILFFSVLFLFLLISMTATYYKYIVQEDYEIYLMEEEVGEEEL